MGPGIPEGRIRVGSANQNHRIDRVALPYLCAHPSFGVWLAWVGLLLFSGLAWAQDAEPKLTKAPEVTTFVEAIYPADKAASRIQSSTVLELTVGEDGRVSDVVVVESGGNDFDQAAKAAVEQFLFSPAEVDGIPAPVRIRYRYDFTLQPEPPQPTSEAQDEPEPNTGRIVGTLRLKGYGTPVIGAELSISSGGEAFTNAQGRFAFESVPVGAVTLKVEDTTYAAYTSELQVTQDTEIEVNIFVEKIGFEDVLRVIDRRIKPEVVRRTVQVEEVRLIPGTNGDALGIVQNLPGAARTSLGRTDLILRGGGRTQAYLDTQPIPIPFHFGGLRSTVSGALIEDIQIIPSNFSVEYGRVNGGVVDIELRRPNGDRWTGFAEADVFDAGLFLEGPIDDKSSIAFALRRSYIDAILNVALPDDAPVTLNSAPRYYDSQILYSTKRQGHLINVLAYGSSDRVVALIEEAGANNPQARGKAQAALEWAGGQIQWSTPGGTSLKNDFNLGYLVTSPEVSFGDAVDLDFFFHQVLLRDRVTWTPSETFTLRTGLDFEILYSDILAYGAGGPPKEGEPQNGGGLQDVITVDAEDVYLSPAIWTDLVWTYGGLQFIPGVRIDRFGQTDEIAVQPRVTVRQALTDQTELKVGAGRYVQVPEGDEYAEGIGNPEVDAESSWHYTVGATHRFSDILSLDTSLFYKDFDGLVKRVDDPEIRVDNVGDGRAYGLEMLLRHELSARFFGWVGYTLQRSERRDSPGEAYRLFDTDQTHNLILIGHYKLTPRWSLGVRWRYVTGNPNSPVEGTIYEADADRFVPVYGEVNSIRDDDFHQLDVRVDYRWIFQTWRLTAYLDVRNAYNRQNGAGRSYNFDYTESEPNTDIPIVPSFGVRGDF